MNGKFITMSTSECEKVKNVIHDFFNQASSESGGFDIEIIKSFFSILQESGSVISGSLIIQAIVRFESRELSNLCIYTDFYGASMINDFLRINDVVELTNQNVYITDAEKSSILREKKINSILEYQMKDRPSIMIKIMIIDNDTSPYEVISNMEFTFCQILFDGINLKSIYPDDVKKKSGTINPKYNYVETISSLEDRIKKYTDRGFYINIEDIYYEDEEFGKYVTPVEKMINFLYKNLLDKLLEPDMYEVLGIADKYINFFYLEEISLEGFFDLLKKLSEDKYTYLLPFWIKDTYEFDRRAIIKALFFESDIIKYLDDASIFYTIMDSLQITDINQEKQKIDIDKFNYNKTPLENKIEQQKRSLNLLVYEKERMIDENRKKFKNTRNIKWLNIIKPKPIESIQFNEKKYSTCYSSIDISDYNINAYLRGEADLDLDSIPHEEAMKRLVFFVANSPELTNLKPYCYNLDMIADDIGKDLFTECISKNNLEDIDKQLLRFPIIALRKLAEWPIYIPLDEFLYALYNTKKQSFILIPTERNIRYTASLSTFFNNDNVSGSHCQEGSYKKLHTIKVCGGYQEDLCWPINIKFTFDPVDDFEPDTYFLKQKYYILAEYEDKLLSEHRVLLRDNTVMRTELDPADIEQLERDLDDRLIYDRFVTMLRAVHNELKDRIKYDN